MLVNMVERLAASQSKDVPQELVETKTELEGDSTVKHHNP